MQAFLPNDVSPVEHVFDLRQLVQMLDAAGHIKLPEGSKVLGAEVDSRGQLIVSIAHGAAYYGPNTSPLKLRHDFADEIKLQEQIKQDAQAAKCKLAQDLRTCECGPLKTIGLDWRRLAARVQEDEKYKAEQHAGLVEEMEQAELQSIKPNLEVNEPAPDPTPKEAPVTEAARPSPAEVNEHIRERVRDLYPKAHPARYTPYAMIFQGSPLERDPSPVVLPFVPGEDVFNILNRFKKLAYEREMSLQLYEGLNGIVQRVHGEGTLSSAEKAKAYLRPENYRIESLPDK